MEIYRHGGLKKYLYEGILGLDVWSKEFVMLPEYRQVEIIKSILISSQIALLEAELERKKGMMKEELKMKELPEKYKDCITINAETLPIITHNAMVMVADYRERGAYNQAINEDIYYLQDQITKCKELLK